MDCSSATSEAILCCMKVVTSLQVDTKPCGSCASSPEGQCGSEPDSQYGSTGRARLARPQLSSSGLTTRLPASC
ncbi:hypothetical protein E2C01_048917 [Portunus trituberculatus]|uniref:Uncharacterized protein n=1 Tax=Portunus trituberculatus TaxID=210409 RepID=A0A5B7GBT2_PORTR|nr:hypothetical protein [Portunus trituberculatus]